MRLRLFGLTLALILPLAVPSWAALDQKCLSECINTGRPSSVCMPQCTTGSAKPQPLQNTGDNHRVLDAPVPSSELILPSTSPKVSVSGKDYGCINQCLKDGWQYQLCETRCTKKKCGTGSAQCKGDLTGSAYNPFQPAGP